MLEIGINGNTVTFDLYTILIWVIVGLIAGFLASAVTRRRGSLLGDILLGVLGAFVGGFFLALLAPIISINVEPWWLRTIITAFIGAVLIILIARAFSPRYYRSA